MENHLTYSLTGRAGLTSAFMNILLLSHPERFANVERTEDAVDWITRNLPYAYVPWLNRGDHSEILDEDDSEYLTAFGPAGHLTLFICDLL